MRSRAVVVMIAAIALMAIPAVRFASPAVAGPICPPGTRATPSAAVDVGAFICMGMNGTAQGGITKSGTYVKTIPGLSAQMAPQLNQTSSTLSAAGGGPPTNNANSAAVNGSPSSGGKLGLGTRVVQNGTAIVSAGLAGYMVGTQIASVACGFGVDLLCKPEKAANVPVNTDVTVTGDSGQLMTSFPASSLSPSISCSLSGGSSTTRWNMTTANGSDPMIMVCEKPSTSQRFTFGWLLSSTTNTMGSSTAGYAQGAGYDSAQGHICTSTGLGWNGTSWGGPVDASGRSAYPIKNLLAGACAAGIGRLYAYIAPEASGPASGRTYPFYAFQGDAQRPAPVVSNPPRQIVTRNTCVKPDGTTVTTNSAPSTTFTETDSDYPEFPAGVPCPAGSTLGGSTTVETSPNLPDKTITGVTVPQKIIDNQKAFPECLGGDCRLTLQRIVPDSTHDTGDCFAKIGRCSGWFADPDKGKNYQCLYGLPGSQKTVVLSECTVYAPTFDRATDPTKAPYGDPDTGAEPGTETGNGNSDPVTDPTPAGGTLGGLDCFPSGFGVFNPVNWILQPIKCALVWAFVPSGATLTDFVTGVRAAFDATALGEWFGALGGLGQIIVPDGGCGGVVLHIPKMGLLGGSGEDATIFATCDQPWSTVALVVKAFITIGIAWATLLGVFRNIASAFGYQTVQ